MSVLQQDKLLFFFTENDGSQDHERDGRHKRDSPEKQEVTIGKVSDNMNVCLFYNNICFITVHHEK